MLVTERLLETKGRPSGFDYLRLMLALSILIIHIVVTSYGDEATNSFWLSWRRPIAAIVLPLFFSLSGFLVTGSLFRVKSLFHFLGLRAIRIVPALAVEVILSAFVLGPIFTTVSFGDYFSDRRFYVYFLNIIGDVHYLLPGVFDDNPHPHVVNGQIWTIPWELLCYISLAALSIMWIVRKRILLLAFAVGFQVAVLIYYLIYPPHLEIAVHGIVLIECFIAGVTLFAFRDKIPLSRTLFLAALVVSLGLLLARYGEYFVAFPVAYLTVYLGMLNPKRNRIAFSGDYSYGIFLYGFPLQQAIAATPIFRTWYADVLLAFPLAIAVAAISWWSVERPALQLRNYIPLIEQYLLRKGGQWAGILRLRFRER